MIKFQSLPRQKKQAIREEVLRLYAETDMSYVEIAEVNGIQERTEGYTWAEMRVNFCVKSSSKCNTSEWTEQQ